MSESSAGAAPAEQAAIAGPSPSAALTAALDAVIGGLDGGGEARPGQRRMAAGVEAAIRDGRNLVVQAGTGTGKSLAYLVPAVLSGKRTIVATATKALQDQLAGKDLPFLASRMPGGFTWAVVKGRANYLCRQRLEEVDASTQEALDLDGLGATARTQLGRLAAWAEQTSSGDRADLDWEPLAAVWSAVSVGGEECPGASRCPAGERCFAEAARARAADADLVVANLALYGVNFRAEGMVLPPHDVVIIDEAHQLEDAISNTVGTSLWAGRFSALAARVRAVLADDRLVADLAAAGSTLASALGPFHGQRLELPLPAAVVDPLVNAGERLARTLDTLGAIKTSIEDADQRRVRAQKAATSLAEEVAVVADLPDGYVAWVEGERHEPRLSIAPLDVGPFLAGTAWKERTAVLTSATLPSVLERTVGLTAARTDRDDVGSPFDYERNGLLYCATHLVDPRHPDHADQLADELTALITAAGGRTLALFTSWKRLDAAVAAVSEQVPYRVLSQRDLPSGRLVAEFRDDESSCLFATTGLFQGIDVPGTTLSLVTVDRIPFPRPDEPLLAARRERAGPAAFATIDLPRAQTLLAQAAGRLIRRADDRGVVAVLDPRLNTARYRWELIRALPPMRRTRHRDEVEAFLAGLRDGTQGTGGDGTPGP